MSVYQRTLVKHSGLCWELFDALWAQLDPPGSRGNQGVYSITLNTVIQKRNPENGLVPGDGRHCRKLWMIWCELYSTLSFLQGILSDS